MESREELTAIAQTVCAAEGVELYWLEYKRRGRRWTLSVYIDKPEGVTIDDCERVSRALEPELDVRIDHSYTLIVSSPGIDRELHTFEHFRRAVGEQVKLKLHRPLAGQTVLIGRLLQVEPQKLLLETEQGQVELTWSQVARARIYSPLTG